MKKKTKITILIIISIFLIISIALYISSKNHKLQIENESTPTILSNSNISVNYQNKEEIEYSKNEYRNKFSITNVIENELNYTLSLINNVGYDEYKLIEIKILCDEEEILNKEIRLDSYNEVLSAIKIAPGQTKRYEIIVKGINVTDTIYGKIHINTSEKKVETNKFATQIKSNSKINNIITTPGKELALSNEELIKGNDEFGDTYYFRGAVENNYVSFLNYKWRIVRITGDNQVKIILDEDLLELKTQYNEVNTNDFTQTKAYNALLNWFNKNLTPYDSILKSINTPKEELQADGYYPSHERIFKSENPSFKNTVAVNSKISLLTADEVTFAGARKNFFNDKFYLYGKNIFNVTPTSTMYSSDKDTTKILGITQETGNLSSYDITDEFTLRPVIILNEKAKFTGTGTIDDPYIIDK